MKVAGRVALILSVKLNTCVKAEFRMGLAARLFNGINIRPIGCDIRVSDKFHIISFGVYRIDDKHFRPHFDFLFSADEFHAILF